MMERPDGAGTGNRAGWCGARGRGSQPRTRDALGSRPPPLWGAAPRWAGRDRVNAGESPRDQAAFGAARTRKHGPRVQSRRQKARMGRKLRAYGAPQGACPPL